MAGVNVWELPWESQGPDPVEVFDPTSREIYRMRCYRVRHGDQILRFAAGETSANVWMFCVKSDAQTEEPRDLVATLNSPDIMARVAAIADFAQRPHAVRPALVAILADSALPVRPRVWAMITICQIGDGGDPVVSRALVDCLADPEAIIRRSAIDTLGVLRVDSAVPKIAACLSDHAPIPEAWFDDNATPSQAARRALESIGSPEARALLAAIADT